MKHRPFANTTTRHGLLGLALALFVITTPGLAHQPTSRDTTFALGISALDFDYEETGEGTTFNREQDVLAGAYLALRERRGLTFGELITSFHSGKVDYNGFTQNRQAISTSTDQDIADAVFLLGVEYPRTSLFAGYGFRYWRRHILPVGNVSGLLERYRWGYGVLGLRHNLFKSERSRWAIDVRITRMINSEVEVDYLGFQGQDGQTLDLGDKWGGRIGLPITVYTHGNYSLVAEPYYEQWDIGRSDLTPVTANGVPTGGSVFEPDSKTRNFGINLILQW